MAFRIPRPRKAATGAEPCTCAVDGLVWAEDPETAELEYTTGELAPIFTLQGAVCPDVELSFSLEWEPIEEEGAEPTITHVGAGAWRVDAAAAGTLIINPSGTCGGAALTLEPLTLTIAIGEAPWVNILTIGGVTPVYGAAYDDDGDVFILVPDVGIWDQAPENSITFTGLAAYIGDHDMEVRATCVSDDGVAVTGSLLLDQLIDPAVDQQTTYEIENASIGDFQTGGGIDSGESTSGASATWRIEVRPIL